MPMWLCSCVCQVAALLPQSGRVEQIFVVCQRATLHNLWSLSRRRVACFLVHMDKLQCIYFSFPIYIHSFSDWQPLLLHKRRATEPIHCMKETARTLNETAD